MQPVHSGRAEVALSNPPLRAKKAVKEAFKGLNAWIFASLVYIRWS